MWEEAAKWYGKESHIVGLSALFMSSFPLPSEHLKRASRGSPCAAMQIGEKGAMTKFLYYLFHHLILKQESFTD